MNCFNITQHVTHQHVDVMHQVKAEEGKLHNEICVVDVGAFALPGPFMIQVPQVNRVPTKTVLSAVFLCMQRNPRESYTAQISWSTNDIT